MGRESWKGMAAASKGEQIALERIEKEADEPMGFLDLARLVPHRTAPALFELKHLQRLSLGNAWRARGVANNPRGELTWRSLLERRKGGFHWVGRLVNNVATALRHGPAQGTICGLLF